MKTQTFLAGSALVLSLASCGTTPAVKAATPQEKAAATASIGKLSMQLQSLNLAGKASSKLAATAVNGSLEFDCPQGGKATLTYGTDSSHSDSGSTTGTYTGTMKLESASCASNDITMSDVNLTLKYDGEFGKTNITVKTTFDGALTIKDSKQTAKFTFSNLTYDSKLSAEPAGTKTKYTATTTINGTVNVNDSFVTYTNESSSNSLTY
jgi:hypothetical protein